MKHRTLALLLASALALSLTACGGDTPSADDAAGSPAASEPNEPEASDSQTVSPEPSDSQPIQSPEESPSDIAQADPEESPSSAPSQSGSVDLQAFFDDLLVKYEGDDFSPNMPVQGDFLTAYYSGLANIALKQQVIYQPMMSGVVCEIALVEVENAADVDAVKAVFQERIDYQVGTDDAPGGAWYPESIEGWKNNSRIVSNGNYVMMIVWENCDQFVDDFNALF